jgi:hypothetical protein
MNACRCSWCRKPFQARSDGGKAQRYCSATCRRAFDGAARAWVRRAIDQGTLTSADLQEASPATRALPTEVLTS